MLAVMFPALQKFFCESTVHSLLHFTGERRVYIKLIWLIALVASFVFCGMRVSEAFTKFFSKEVSTTIKEGALTFEFPDVYICNESPMSGSYAVTLSAENDKLLNEYRRIVNETVIKTTKPDNRLEDYALRLINTLPLQFLSDNMGHQIWQSVIDFTINDSPRRKTIVTYRHNTYLNCLFLNLSDDDREVLSSPISRLSLTLFTDPQLPEPFDNSTQQDVIDSTNVKPFDWDINYGYDYSRATGFRIFFTPRGHQPTEWSTQFIAGGGQRKEVEIMMEDVIFKADDFLGQCVEVDSSVNVEYVNLYDNEKELFKYEMNACMLREFARLSQETLKCSPNRYPLPWDYRALPSCFNVTAVAGLNLTDLYNNIPSRRNHLTGDVMKLCRGKAPCKRRFYTFRHFSTDWPSDRLLRQYLRNFIEDQMISNHSMFTEKSKPGIQYLLMNGSASEARSCLLQLTLSAADENCTETQMAIAYTSNSLIADAGGLLGLFLGMSLLSVLELVELLHDCVLILHERLAGKKSVADSGASVDKVISLQPSENGSRQTLEQD